MTGGARFAVGARVRIRDLPTATHHRTPHYVRGQVGEIARFCGAHPDPERLAYGDPAAPPVRLYRVRFSQTALWAGYSGAPGDEVDVEIYEHWLEPVAEETPR